MKLIVPEFEDMWFRENLLSDTATMKYNEKWGGTISFPKERWKNWYDHWINNTNKDRFYRYILDENKEFVGEVAYHWDEDTHAYIADVIVMDQYRGKGYGTSALKLLCVSAKRNGLKALNDTIAIDNPPISIFIKAGFIEEYRTEEYIMKKRYDMPAIMRGFLDKVMLEGSAYTTGAAGLTPVRAISKTYIFTTSSTSTDVLVDTFGDPINNAMISATFQIVGFQNAVWKNLGAIDTSTSQERQEFLDEVRRMLEQ